MTSSRPEADFPMVEQVSAEPPTVLPLATGDGGCCGWGGSCCDLSRWGLRGLGLAFIAAMALGGYLLGRAGQSSATPAGGALPLIDATAAVSSDNYSMATGAVSGEAEGLFVLDHNSGLLQCSVIYPRVGRFAAVFSARVGDALATGGKGGKYLMVTGMADFPRNSSVPIGNCVVYVLDTATGQYACYGVPFNRVMMNANQPQSGTLQLIAVGSANPLADRDALR